MMLNARPLSRRRILAAAGLASVSLIALPFPAVRPARAALPELEFDELYGKISPLGLTFSEKLERLKGQKVRMDGFMAPPLKAEAQFFVLSSTPLSICPFCSSDADWPEDIVVVYLTHRQTFVQYNARITVEGVLEVGSWTDPETGFVSLVRLANARFWQA